MFEITRKELLGPKVYLMDIVAPRVAERALPGQFLIVRADAEGERQQGKGNDYHCLPDGRRGDDADGNT